MGKLKRLVSNIWLRIPMLGQLAGVRRNSIRAALKELFVSAAFSTAPIWFFPIIAAIAFVDSEAFRATLEASVSQGEFYLYSAALVGPLIYAITAEYGSWNAHYEGPTASKIGKLTFAFPYGSWFFVISLLVCGIAAICFGILRFRSDGWINARLNYDGLFWLSVGIYFFTLLCLFCASVYRNELQIASSKLNQGQDAFAEEWRSRNG